MPDIDYTRLILRAARVALAERQRLGAALAGAEAALAETDWLVIRQAEGGPAVPPGVRETRRAARAQASALREALAALPPAALPPAAP